MLHRELASCVINNEVGEVLFGRFPHPLEEGPTILELPTICMPAGLVSVKELARKALWARYGLEVVLYNRIGAVQYHEGDLQCSSQLLAGYIEQPRGPVDREGLIFWEPAWGLSDPERDETYQWGPVAAQLIDGLSRSEVEI